MVLPLATALPLKVQAAGGLTTQEEYAYEPERAPLVQVRVCDVQVEPYGTLSV